MTTRALCGLLAIGLLPLPAGAAFHEREGNCGGCHVTHNSIDGMPVVPGGGNEYQLLADEPSDVCLLCHAREAGAVLGLNPLAPPPEKGGGNFVFLLEDNLNDAPDGLLDPIPGDAAIHENQPQPPQQIDSEGTARRERCWTQDSTLRRSRS